MIRYNSGEYALALITLYFNMQLAITKTFSSIQKFNIFNIFIIGKHRSTFKFLYLKPFSLENYTTKKFILNFIIFFYIKNN